MLTTAGFNRRMRKIARPVVWKAHGAQSPWAHPIKPARQRATLGGSTSDLTHSSAAKRRLRGARRGVLALGPWVGRHVGSLEALDGDMGINLRR
jgi:hypothetical protein